MRYAAVPWLSDSDFLPAGSAEWAVELPDRISLGWMVRHPFHHTDHVMVIRASRGNGKDGGVVTLALGDVFDAETSTVAVRNTQHSRTFFDGSHTRAGEDDSSDAA